MYVLIRCILGAVGEKNSTEMFLPSAHRTVLEQHLTHKNVRKYCFQMANPEVQNFSLTVNTKTLNICFEITRTGKKLASMKSKRTAHIQEIRLGSLQLLLPILRAFILQRTRSLFIRTIHIMSHNGCTEKAYNETLMATHYSQKY